MAVIDLRVEPGFYICYKAGTGRGTAMGPRFDSCEQAQAYLDEAGKVCMPPTDFNETMHVVEVTNA